MYTEGRESEIAVIGMSCRFPGARDVREYWHNLCDGVESISFFTVEDLVAAGISRTLLQDPSYIRAFGALTDAYSFDAQFFGVSPLEAQIMDPQQRVFLECAWNALEDAGCDPGRFEGAIGVFAGSGDNAHYARVMSHPDLVANVGTDVTLWANNRDLLTTRVSYKLGLRGPSVAIQTACSTSLVAIHMASQCLLNGECDLALAGGVSIVLDQITGYRYQEGGIVSPDGHCRPFDALAAGTVGGSGAGVVVLKRLADALNDRDTILAVVKGSAINNDGADKVGFTAPSVRGQVKVIAEALAAAGLDSSEISYIESHGTGTPLGDPIEAAALREVFSPSAERTGHCALGAVKSNIGHLDTAAGVAGFIKVVLALKHRTIPPTLHFKRVNPETGLESSCIKVNAALRHWEGNGTPRRAGVSSFGIGGTNAHVILEEWPHPESADRDDGPQLLVLSAKSEDALKRLRHNIANYLTDDCPTMLADVAYTLREGRAMHPFRWATVAKTIREAREALNGISRVNIRVQKTSDRPSSVTFLFPGQGTQYAGMTRRLYDHESVFRIEIDKCLTLLRDELGLDLRSVLFPIPGEEHEADVLLQDTRYTQPALFTIEYGLAKLWMSWGAQPQALLGHSIGEYAAACIAGIFSLPEALRLVEARGRLVHALPEGAMLAVLLPEHEVLPLVPFGVSLAAVNTNTHCVLSGSIPEIQRVESLLAANGVTSRRLKTSHAFHSNVMDSILQEFGAEVEKAHLAPPTIPLVSNVTGDWITPEQAVSPQYWVRQLRDAVRFGAGLRRLLERPNTVLLEVGPGDTLGTFALHEQIGGKRVPVIKSLPSPHETESSDRTVLEALGVAWMAGVEVEWANVRRKYKPHRVSLPGYPFDRTEYKVSSACPAPVIHSPSPVTAVPPVAVSQFEAISHKGSAPSRQVNDKTTSIESPDRQMNTKARIATLVARLLGVDPSQLDATRSFVELGADSLLLMQASRSLETEFRVRVPFRRLLQELCTIDELSEHIDREVPRQDDSPITYERCGTVPFVPLKSVTMTHEPATLLPRCDQSRNLDNDLPMNQIIEQQLELMQTHGAIMKQQLTALRVNGRDAERSSRLGLRNEPESPNTADMTKPAAGDVEIVPHGPYRPVRKTILQGHIYTDRQAAYVSDFLQRYTTRTRLSKEYAAKYRAKLSDNRATLGFRMRTKEFAYPIVGVSSRGSRLWDIDGNEYIDFTLGFGVHFFGHQPAFILEAVEQQLKRGIHLGPQSDLAGPVAQLVSDLTGMERVTFCNTGSEAVMTAIRIARAATSRDRIVMFEGSYHGCFDGVLARGRKLKDLQPHSVPAASGTPQRMVDDVVVLPYGTDETLDWLKANAAGVAAVLVEPVQSQNPDLIPREFLREVRTITEETETVLIFDEMITGFRLGLKGAQGLFGVEADLATYGKVIGGGFPLGVVAGSTRLMNAIDGGLWTFGDDSFPAADQTFFAGTFCKHPIALAAAGAVLRHLAERGSAVYEELNARTNRLLAGLRDIIAEYQLPIHIASCGSLFRFVVNSDEPLSDLLFYHLLDRGMYIWEARGCFLSTVHSDHDCDELIVALRDSVCSLDTAGFLSTETSSGQPRSSRSTKPTFPLTPAQHQVWVHAQLGDDASRAYNEQLVFEVHGSLRLDSLRDAFRDVIHHHEGLRTVFSISGEEQHVLPSVPIDLQVSATLREGDLTNSARLLRDAASEGFDLQAGPLFRVHIYPLGNDHHYVQIVFHHLVMDAIGAIVFLQDLAMAYSARVNSNEPTLPAAMQLSEYVKHLAENTGTLVDREEHWLTRFRGAVPLQLPTARPRPLIPTGVARQVTKVLAPDIVAKLKTFGSRERATLFMTLVGGLLAALHRITEQDDVVLGIPSSGRFVPDSERLVAHCIQVLPIRSLVGGKQRLLPFLRAIRQSLLEAYEDEPLPLPRLMAKLNVPRSQALAPLISVTFNLEPNVGPNAQRRPQFAGLQWDRLEGFHNLFAKFDLHIDALERQDRLDLFATFNADLLEQNTVERILTQLERVLEEVVSGADPLLSTIPTLSEAERSLIVYDWNRIRAYPSKECIHRLFEQQVQRTPDALAITFDGHSITYNELNERANRLAHLLLRHGVAPEVRVGVCLGRNVEMVLAILAVLKAGGAYVPLDPTYPAERLSFMLVDSGASVVLAENFSARLFIDVGDVKVVMLDDIVNELTSESILNPEVKQLPENLAYVIYTSGSTGRPKGTLVEHRNISRLFRATEAWFGFGTQDVWTLFHSYSFDFSVWEIFGALLYGGRLVIIPYAISRDPKSFHSLVRSERVTVLNQTPSAFRQFIHADLENRSELALRLVIFGGEALEPATLREWVILHGTETPRLVNMFGITETSVHATYKELSRQDVCERTGSPIGQRIPDLELYVLDQWLQPLPVGVGGELYVGGAGVARGYLNRPELTQERFIANPFGPGRLYRTGDQVRWLADGNLDYLGRLDTQVKIRGFRIEVGEIEAAMLGHDHVRDAAVVALPDDSGTKRLIAYFVGSADISNLRMHLSGILPDYMVPAIFVRLDALPLTPSGKLDRKALPAPEYVANVNDYVAPQTPFQEALAHIWADVLRLERVGIENNFFELGGDSILAIQVASRARRLGMDLTPRQLFQHRTIGELAADLENTKTTLPPVEQDFAVGSVPLTPVQAWFFEQDLVAPWHFNQSVILEVAPGVTAAALEVGLNAVLRHFDALRLRFIRKEPGGWEQEYASEAGICLDRIDLSDLPLAEQDRLQDELTDQKQKSLNLEHGPLGCAVLFDRGERGRMLLLVLHHLVVDGVSWRILYETLEHACAQADGGYVDLGPRTTSYGAWADALRQYAASSALQEEANYWLSQKLDGLVSLPRNESGSQGPKTDRTVVACLEVEETQALLRDVPSVYRTQINDILLCALVEAINRMTGTGRVHVMLEGHGREEDIGHGVDLTGTLGWFTSLYPVLLDTAEETNPGQRLKCIKEQLYAVPKRGIGYGVLRYLSPDITLRGRLASQVQPEISFNYLGQIDIGQSSERRFAFLDRPLGRESAEINRLPFSLDINAAVSGGNLRLHWTYDKRIYQKETIERLVSGYCEALRVLIAHCRERDAGGYSPSDFPLAELTQEELDTALGSRRDIEDLYPLTPMQEGMLFHALSGTELQEYQVEAAYRLEGVLDINLFQRAWDELVMHHPILRTSFLWDIPRRPLQLVQSGVKLAWQLEDWRGLNETTQETALERYLIEDRRRGFDLRQAPLMRCAVFRVRDQAHWFVWSQHHLLMDGWTGFRLLSEAFRVYEALTRGEPLESKPGRPYRDFIAWLHRQDQQAAERYWRGALKGFVAPTTLGVEPPTTAVEAAYAKQSSTLSETLTQRLEDFARTAQVTLNTVLLSAWGLLLSRYSGDEDVVFGATVSGRSAKLEGVEEMIGLFINTLPVRMQLRGDLRLRNWLQEVQNTQVEAREYEYAPLAQIQRWSELPPGTPLFEISFIFENYPVERSINPQPPHLRLTHARSIEWNNFPLSLMVYPGPELQFHISYDQRRFSFPTIQRMLEHFERVVETIVDNPDVRLSEVELVTAAERRQIDGWNQTGAEYPAQQCVHELFEAQVARTPNAVAVVFGDELLTYAELEGRANRLAQVLRHHGIGPDKRVGICLERGLQLTTAVLGVLKAGGAWVPLDPSYPVERLNFLIADSGVAVMLVQEELPAGVSGEGIVALSVDGATTESSHCGAYVPATGVAVNHLAYVIYTSGSTGTPKGVMVEHRNVVNFLNWARHTFAVGPETRLCAVTSFTFDISVLEILLPLISGGRIIIVANEDRLDGFHLARHIKEHQATLMQATPATWRLLLETGWRVPPNFQILCGGEEMPLDLVNELLSDDGQVWNLYGPTETTIWSCAYQLTTVRKGRIPIGRPLDNTEVYILDRWNKPLPVGVAGELYVGGAGVARGYLNRPELTQERFIANPFGPGRLYRTGDQVRWLADGNLDYLGRLDTQVKIRGFRIEVGEIEAAMLGHDHVRDAAVVALPDDSGTKRLIAYFVGSADISNLRMHLSGILPDYMVPAIFVRLDALPLTPSGKLDRKALPAPEYVANVNDYVAPQTPFQEALAHIWADVLRLERVGIENNFFELGGDSILAIQVASRARRLGMDLTPRQLFQHRTIGELAADLENTKTTLPPVEQDFAVGSPHCRERDAGGYSPSDFPLAELTQEELDTALGSRRDIEDLYPLTPMQEGMLFHALSGTELQEYQVEAAYRLEGVLDINLFQRAWDELVMHHPILRTSFLWDIPRRPLQLVQSGVKLAWQLEDWRGLNETTQETALERYLIEDRRRGFDLRQAPLMRCAVFRVRDQAHWFVWSQHHLLMDGWTGFRLLSEAFRVYEALTRGEPLESKPGRPYRDFIAWLHRQDQQAAERYWRGALKGFVAPTTLGVEPPTTAVEAAYAKQSSTLSETLTQRLEDFARTAQVTLNTVLLSAWGLLLSRYSGDEDVVFGATVSGRSAKLEGVEEMIGLFINTLPVRMQLRGDLRLRNWLQEVQNTQVEAREYEYAPLAQIQRWSELPPGTPLFEISFIFENYPVERSINPQPPHLRLTHARSIEWNNFPLTLVIRPRALYSSRQLQFHISYDQRRFSFPTIQRMLEHFERVVETIVDNPDVRLSEVELVTAAERRQIDGWNQSTTAYSKKPVHVCFAEQALKTPDSVALLCRGQVVTYDSLERRAEALAQRLRSLGVRPEIQVGLCADVTPDLVVGVLAIWKAGGAFVPLDPGYPADRLQWMVKHSGVSLVLTTSDPPLAIAEATVVNIKALLETDEALEIREPAHVSLTNLAYVIYTSGSTGHPKGVLIQHDSLSNLLASIGDSFRVRSGDVMAAVSSYSFDIWLLETFVPLTSGAAVNLISREQLLSSRGLFEGSPDVTLLHAVPALMRTIVTGKQEADFRNLRQLFVGGDRVPSDLIAQMQSTFPGVGVEVFYGPTESTILSTTHETPVRGVTTGYPIGRPLSNVRAYVCDCRLRLQPIGVAGELLVGGINVGRGYWRSARQTADRFVPDPFSTDAGLRLYRTGDRVRWRADGSLEYLGRVDRQVKIRGFRIEPEEIEKLLRLDEHVSDCSVQLRQENGCEPTLVAYIVGDATPATLESRLRDSLPEYMVPNAIVVLDQMPLLPNGKLDARLLPPPNQVTTESDRQASTTVEDVLAHVWKDILGVKHISVTDNFYALGGHSLLVMRLITEIQDAFGVDLPIRTIFALKSLEALAQEIERKIHEQTLALSEENAMDLLASSDLNMNLNIAKD